MVTQTPRVSISVHSVGLRSGQPAARCIRPALGPRPGHPPYPPITFHGRIGGRSLRRHRDQYRDGAGVGSSQRCYVNPPELDSVPGACEAVPT
jgi:hypothetical protein